MPSKRHILTGSMCSITILYVCITELRRTPLGLWLTSLSSHPGFAQVMKSFSISSRTNGCTEGKRIGIPVVFCLWIHNITGTCRQLILLCSGRFSKWNKEKRPDPGMDKPTTKFAPCGVASELFVHIHNRMVRCWALCSLTHFHAWYSATCTPER